MNTTTTYSYIKDAYVTLLLDRSQQKISNSQFDTATDTSNVRNFVYIHQFKRTLKSGYTTEELHSTL